MAPVFVDAALTAVNEAATALVPEERGHISAETTADYAAVRIDPERVTAAPLTIEVFSWGWLNVVVGEEHVIVEIAGGEPSEHITEAVSILTSVVEVGCTIWTPPNASESGERAILQVEQPGGPLTVVNTLAQSACCSVAGDGRPNAICRTSSPY